jgi:hypothetical protein
MFRILVFFLEGKGEKTRAFMFAGSRFRSQSKARTLGDVSQKEWEAFSNVPQNERTNE